MLSNRLTQRFARLRRDRRTGLVVYLVAGDPDFETSLRFLHIAAAAGADVIELGYPFSDPILDGPVIQRANRRALDSGGTLAAAFALLSAFRETDRDTPVVLMGYAHPIVAWGEAAFVDAAARASADGLIMADMPLAMARRRMLPALAEAGLVAIPLAAPMLDRGDVISNSAGQGGFLYCIPVAGPTGGPAPSIEAVEKQVMRWRETCDLPVAVGFGVKTPTAARSIGQVADAVVVASVFIDRISHWMKEGLSRDDVAHQLGEMILTFRSELDGAKP